MATQASTATRPPAPPPPSYSMATTPSRAPLPPPIPQPLPLPIPVPPAQPHQLRRTRDKHLHLPDDSSDQDSWEAMAAEASALERGRAAAAAAYAGAGAGATAYGNNNPFLPGGPGAGAGAPPSSYRPPAPPTTTTTTTMTTTTTAPVPPSPPRPLPSPPHAHAHAPAHPALGPHPHGPRVPPPHQEAHLQHLPQQQQQQQRPPQPPQPTPAPVYRRPIHAPGAPHLPPSELERDLPSLPALTESPRSLGRSMGDEHDRDDHNDDDGDNGVSVGGAGGGERMEDGRGNDSGSGSDEGEGEGSESSEDLPLPRSYSPVPGEIYQGPVVPGGDLARGGTGSSGETARDYRVPRERQRGTYDVPEQRGSLVPLLPMPMALAMPMAGGRYDHPPEGTYERPREERELYGREREHEREREEGSGRDDHGHEDYDRDREDGDDDGPDEDRDEDQDEDRERSPPRLGTPEPLTIAPDTPDVPILLPNGNTKLLFRMLNPNPRPIAFKVMTTQPRIYSVRPNYGLVPPGQSVDLEVHAPADVNKRRGGGGGAGGRYDRFAVLSRFVEREREADLEEREDFSSLFPSKTTSAPQIRSQRFRIRPLLVPAGTGTAGTALSSAGSAYGTGGGSASAFAQSPLQRARAFSPGRMETASSVVSPTFTSSGLPMPMGILAEGAVLAAAAGLGAAAGAAGAGLARARSPTIRFADAGHPQGMASLGNAAAALAATAEREAREARELRLATGLGEVKGSLDGLRTSVQAVLSSLELERAGRDRAREIDDLPAEMELAYPSVVVTPGKRGGGRGVRVESVWTVALVVFVGTYYARVGGWI